MNGTRVRQLRYNAGLSIAELARKSGVSVGHIYRIEAGESGKLRLSTITKIAKALEAEEDELFPSAPTKTIWTLSGTTWHVVITCPKCGIRFRLVVEEGSPEPGEGGVSCPGCGFVQSISLRRVA